MFWPGLQRERGADELRGDRQLAAAAVHQRGEPHARRPAVVEHLVQRRAYGAAGVEHVVDQDQVAAFDLERNLGALDVAVQAARLVIVAVEGNVEGGERRLRA